MNKKDIRAWVRPNILKMIPYSSARTEFKGEATVWIDANENPFGQRYNRYPDPLQGALKQRLAEIRGVDKEQLFIGNGSDEIIDLLVRAFCEPGRDAIVTFRPSYTMYITSAEINNVEVKEFNLTNSFQLPMEEIRQLENSNAKILFICNPNNPIGNVISTEQIEEVCQLFEGIVVVDEAYIDFSSTPTSVNLLNRYTNLLVLQTLSKAYGMAGLRLGLGMANAPIIEILNRIKPPYNVSQATQDLVLDRLKCLPEIDTHIALLIEEREVLYKAFASCKLFTKVYPSEANFVLVQTPQYKELYQYLCKQGIVARVRHIPPLLAEGLRFSVGLPCENKLLLTCINQFQKEYPCK